MRMQLDRTHYGSGEINISAEIDKVKRELHLAQDSMQTTMDRKLPKIPSKKGANKAKSVRDGVEGEVLLKVDKSALRLNIASTPKLTEQYESSIPLLGVTGDEDK